MFKEQHKTEDNQTANAIPGAHGSRYQYYNRRSVHQMQRYQDNNCEDTCVQKTINKERDRSESEEENTAAPTGADVD